MNRSGQSISDARAGGLNFRTVKPMMTPEIRRALDAVYAVFARYDAPDTLGIGGNFQLHDLTVARWHALDKQFDLGVLMFSDDGELFRYLLPRWLEWLIQDPATRDDLGRWELDNVGTRLAQAQWQNWPADEVAALRELFAVWTRAEIAQHGGAPPHSWAHHEENLGAEGERMGLDNFAVWSELLHFLADVGDVAAYLELWIEANLPQLARWLWIEDLPHHKGAREWIVSSRLENELENAFFADADGPNAELFSRSIELVRALRQM